MPHGQPQSGRRSNKGLLIALSAVAVVLLLVLGGVVLAIVNLGGDEEPEPPDPLATTYTPPPGVGAEPTEEPAQEPAQGPAEGPSGDFDRDAAGSDIAWVIRKNWELIGLGDGDALSDYYCTDDHSTQEFKDLVDSVNDGEYDSFTVGDSFFDDIQIQFSGNDAAFSASGEVHNDDGEAVTKFGTGDTAFFRYEGGQWTLCESAAFEIDR